ncbi:hypothetical protein GQ44DRAFT_764828 [Phaeosphaeriaceae sp. PMI808]|nr:hypothetical protein GQ44DRAFT_764828 [Phaeosphaeriaceae sp. PMI808]
MTDPGIDSTLPLGHYYAALQRIVKFVKQVRVKQISDSELKVTMEFAGPMMPGGLLFLLLQPRENHPWSKGTTEVIEQCPTWCCLKEAVYICSAGTLNLVTDVSVLDLGPFLSKESYERLTDDQKHKLNDLVFDAIRSKKPETLLVLTMGEIAAKFNEGFIKPRKLEIQTTSGTPSEVIFTRHPSTSANYHPDCRTRRKTLLRAVERACAGSKLERQNSFRSLTLLRAEPGFNPLAIYSQPQATKFKGSRPIQDLLLMLGQLCFRGCNLPQPSLHARHSDSPESFFAFKRWHIEKIRCLLQEDKSRHNERDRARANLIPFFLMLNASLKRVSYFFLEHEVNWRQVQKALTYVPAGFHSICQVLSGSKSNGEDSLSVASLFDELPYAESRQKRNVAEPQIERLITCLEGLEPNKNYARFYTVPRRRLSVVELVLDCDRKKGATLMEGVRSALFKAHRPDHSCNHSCKENKWEFC